MRERKGRRGMQNEIPSCGVEDKYHDSGDSLEVFGTNVVMSVQNWSPAALK